MKPHWIPSTNWRCTCARVWDMAETACPRCGEKRPSSPSGYMAYGGLIRHGWVETVLGDEEEQTEALAKLDYAVALWDEGDKDDADPLG